MSKKGIHNYSFRNVDLMYTERLLPTPNAMEEAGCILDDSWEIITKDTDSRLTRYFSGDLVRFLDEAFGIYPRLRRVKNVAEALQETKKKIFLFEAEDIPGDFFNSEMNNAFHITVTPDMIMVIGRTERGTAQGVYYMEDHMKLRGECRLREECAEHAPLFSPRMTHSGTELDTFPDTFLEACAHAGMDAIIVYAGHVDTCLHGFPDPDPLWPGSGRGYCDFNNLVWRAAGYGLDVYIYSHLICDMHPRDPQAKEYYEASFGTLFKKAPGIKGIIFVGETFEFPSLDPHTCGCRCQLKAPGDTRYSPGWYPCFDYPELVTMVRDTIYQYNPEADIVFWSYNWGWAPKEERLELIRNLPRDITLLVTFDMFEKFSDEKGTPYTVDDYSISFEGPAQVYIDEALEAKKCGIRLYSMANTGGRTWDNGIVPYLPVPMQWQKRYEKLRQTHKEHGLCGLMEDHHYGWFPSFLTLFSKNAFMTNGLSDDEMLQRIAQRDFGNEAGKVLEAWKLFSEGIRAVIPAACDQYGPYRCGPTYPLLFEQKQKDLQLPSVGWATHGGFEIWFPEYPDVNFDDPSSMLLRYERVKKTEICFRKGCTLLQEAVDMIGAPKGSEQSKQLAVAGFLHSTYVTALHVMEWSITKNLLHAAVEKIIHDCDDMIFEALGLTDRSVQALAERMHMIARLETENVENAISFYEEDSRIGFEPTMEYMFDHEHAEWKNEETKKSLEQLEEYLVKAQMGENR